MYQVLCKVNERKKALLRKKQWKMHPSAACFLSEWKKKTNKKNPPDTHFLDWKTRLIFTNELVLSFSPAASRLHLPNGAIVCNTDVTSGSGVSQHRSHVGCMTVTPLDLSDTDARIGWDVRKDREESQEKCGVGGERKPLKTSQANQPSFC